MNKAFLNTVKSVNRADLSTTAKTVFIELLCNANPKKPHVFVDAAQLSESVGRAASTIRKAVRELVTKGFLLWEGFVVQLKHKVYKLIFDGVVKVVSKVLAKTEERSSEKPVAYGDQVVPLSQKAEYGEVIKCLTRFGLPHELVCELLAVQGLRGCQELVLEFMKNWGADQTLHPETWFRRYSSSHLPAAG